MRLIKNYLTNNPCYQQGKPLKPTSIQVHSIGTPQPLAQKIMDNWNRSSAGAMVHAVLEPGGDVYEIMEYNKRPWADRGYGNQHAIAFEMTEPDTIRYTGGANWEEKGDGSNTKAHVLGTYKVAVEYVAYLCRKFGLNPLGKTADGVPVVFSHKEGALRGISSNHADPNHLWDVYGLTMDQFRKDVKTMMDGGNIDVETEDNLTPPTPTPPAASAGGYTAGKEYVLQANMSVRTGPGVGYRRKAHNELTADGQKHDRDGNGCLEAGTVVTCKEVSISGADVWIRTPSGWICAQSAGVTYIKEDAAPAPSPAPEPTPAPEPSGDDWIRQLQHQLNVQFSAGLAEDGIAGPKTLAACITCRPGARGEITRLIQSKVGSTADGIWGNNTTVAVRAYQSAHGLAADGIVGKNTWRAMLGL